MGKKKIILFYKTETHSCDCGYSGNKKAVDLHIKVKHGNKNPKETITIDKRCIICKKKDCKIH